MRLTRTFVPALAVSGLIVASVSVMQASGRPPGVAGTPLVAELLGENEIPPADTNGFGAADVRVNSGRGKISLDVYVEDTAPITRIHIHAGDATTNGPVVVFFFDTVVDPEMDPIPVDSNGVFLSFVAEEVDRDLVKDIRKHPANYYVNVHTEAFPAGEIRGQLARP